MVTKARKCKITYSGPLGIWKSKWGFKLLQFWVPRRRAMRSCTVSLTVQLTEVRARRSGVIWEPVPLWPKFLYQCKSSASLTYPNALLSLWISPSLSSKWKENDFGWRLSWILGLTPPASCVIPGTISSTLNLIFFFFCKWRITIPILLELRKSTWQQIWICGKWIITRRMRLSSGKSE